MSTFTSDDEGESPQGLLKTVRERDDESEDCSGKFVRNISTASSNKDAESQTEGITCAKKIILGNDDEARRRSCPSPSGSTQQKQNIIFVPTKRAIFSPVIGETDLTEKVVLIEDNLRSPSLVKNILHQHPGPFITGLPPAPPLAPFKINSSSINGAKGFWGLRTHSESDSRKSSIMFSNTSRPVPPKITSSLPKWEDQSKTRVGKIPVWCSPLGARRQFNVKRSYSSDNGSLMDRPVGEPPMFTIDKFLKDTNLVLKESTSGGQQCGITVNNTSNALIRKNAAIKIPFNTARVSRKYTIGGGIPPREPRQHILCRSNSFGYHREPDDYANPFGQVFFYDGNMQPMEVTAGASNCMRSMDSQLPQAYKNVSVPKSHSSGSIRGFIATKLKFGGKHAVISSTSGYNNEQIVGEDRFGAHKNSPVMVTPLESVIRGSGPAQDAKKKSGWLSKK